VKTFRNTKHTARNHECTNVIACQAVTAPAAHWVECSETVLVGLQSLWVVNGARFYGYL
jgi:hypothetical protein